MSNVRTETLGEPVKQHWYDGLERRHWKILTASFLGWIFDGFEAYALFVVMPLVLKSLLTAPELASAPVYAGFAISSTLLGWGIGGMIGGILADYVGRKRMMMLSVFLYALFTGLTALSPSFGWFVFLRFITGLAMGSEWSTGIALLAETWPNHARPKGAGFLQSGFGWGTLLATVVWIGLSQMDLGPDAWRWMFVVGAIPALFVLYIRRAVDESERWVEAVKQKRWATTEQSVQKAGTEKRPFTLTEIFRDPESRRRIFLTFILSLVTTVGWWAISSWLPVYATSVAKAAGYDTPQLWGSRAAMLYTMGAVAAYIVSGFLIDALGRRKYLFFTFLGALIMTPVTYLWTHSVPTLLVMSFINGFFTLGCAYSWMAIYPAELFTSSVRATAVSFIFNAARLLAWIFPIIAGWLIKTLGGVPQAAMTLGCIYILGLVVPWFVPETKGKPLPDDSFEIKAAR